MINEEMQVLFIKGLMAQLEPAAILSLCSLCARDALHALRKSGTTEVGITLIKNAIIETMNE
jgi:hypothetical protein